MSGVGSVADSGYDSHSAGHLLAGIVKRGTSPAPWFSHYPADGCFKKSPIVMGGGGGREGRWQLIATVKTQNQRKIKGGGEEDPRPLAGLSNSQYVLLS